MTLRLFKRVAKVTVQHPTNLRNEWFSALGNQVEITDLRIQFKVEKSLTRDPNSAEITITNLNKNSRTEFAQKPLIVTLYAGHDDNLKRIYSGDLRYGSSELKPPDWETKMQLGSGDRAYRFARISKSYTKGTNVLTAVRDVAKSMGLTAPNNIDSQLVSQFSAGEVLIGPSRDALTRLLSPFGYYWSIQDDHLLVLRDGDIAPGQALLISQDTGMIGSPEASAPERPGTKKGNRPTVKVKILLYPGINPGQLIKIESKAITGTFKVSKVSHTGDTHGDDWFTEIEGKPD